MPKTRSCPGCSFDFARASPYCPHCGRDSYFANVDDAADPEEVQALEQRYQDALTDGVSRSADTRISEFERCVVRAPAVSVRWLGDVEGWASSDSTVYATYYDKIEAGLQQPVSDDWNRMRAVMDEVLFPGYKEQIRFAALSLNGKGPPGYGDCHITFREAMIAHRATVFEANSLLWVRDKMQICDLKILLPAGFRARWEDRHKLAVAKLANQVSASTKDEEFADLLLKPGATASDHEFVEVHIWGPMTRRTIERVGIEARPPRSTKRRATLTRERILEQKLKSVGVEVDWIG